MPEQIANYEMALDAIREIVGAGFVYRGESVPASYRMDWSGCQPVEPLALIRPSIPSEVASVMRICHEHGLPVVPQGGLSGLAGGAVPLPNALSISMDRLSQIESVDVGSCSMTVQAGVTLQTVQEGALKVGMEFGVDFGARGTCQIGGAIATNAGGSGVIQNGMMRAQTLALEVVLADGTVLPLGQSMLKNNAGYDLKQWFIGSEGTLGIITRATLKLRPLQRARISALLGLQDFDSAIQTLRRLQAQFPGCLAAFEVMWRDFVDMSLQWNAVSSPLTQDYPFCVLVEITGADESALSAALLDAMGKLLEEGHVADAVIAQSKAQARALWRIREASADFTTHMLPINFDVSLPIEQIGLFADECVRALTQRWPTQKTLRFGHLGDGNLHLTTDLRSLGNDMPQSSVYEIEHLIYSIVQRRGGSISAEHGIGLHKKPYLNMSRVDVEIALMRTIKQALDPKNLLNPSKIFDMQP